MKRMEIALWEDQTRKGWEEQPVPLALPQATMIRTKHHGVKPIRLGQSIGLSRKGARRAEPKVLVRNSQPPCPQCSVDADGVSLYLSHLYGISPVFGNMLKLNNRSANQDWNLTDYCTHICASIETEGVIHDDLYCSIYQEPGENPSWEQRLFLIF